MVVELDFRMSLAIERPAELPIITVGIERAGPSEAHVSSVFNDVVNDEDADGAVRSGVARLVAEVTVASKHNGNAVVHVVPTA